MAASEFTAVVKYEPTTAQNPDAEQSAASGSTLKGATAFGGKASSLALRQMPADSVRYMAGNPPAAPS
jgi:hypothetical protein